MATPAEVGKNKHRALIEDGRAGMERVMRTLAEMIEEIDTQHRQARPRLDGLAVLAARAVRQAVTVDGLLAEMQDLVAGMRATRTEVEELQEEVAALRAMVAGLVERQG
jgi:ABC-type transporter Mla subunit MlaD